MIFIKTLRSFLLLVFILSGAAVAAQPSANTLIASVYNKLLSVKAYRADALIVADLPLVKIQPVQATLSFNQKEQFKLISQGIAVLPKQGLNDLPLILRDTTSFTAVISGKEKMNTVQTTIINVIPNSDTGDVVLAKLWIDPIKSLVYKSQITTRENGTLVIEYFYKTQLNAGLPDSIVFTVDVKKFKMPKGLASDINRPKESEEKTANTPKSGKITMTITNYKF